MEKVGNPQGFCRGILIYIKEDVKSMYKSISENNTFHPNYI